MSLTIVRGLLRRVGYPFLAVTLAVGIAAAGARTVFAIAQPAAHAPLASVNLRTARNFSVLGGQTVTNTGPTTVSKSLGVSPGTSVTGFPPGVVAGKIHAADTAAANAQTDLTAAYNDAATRPATGTVAGDIGGHTITPGIYKASSSLGLTGTVTLNGQGDPNAVFIFQIRSTLTTASASTVKLINGAKACNVFWQIGSSATLGTGSEFTGTILALTSITVTTDVRVTGRALARNGAVTLDTDTFITPTCKAPKPTPTVTVTVTYAYPQGPVPASASPPHTTAADRLRPHPPGIAIRYRLGREANVRSATDHARPHAHQARGRQFFTAPT